MDTLRNTIRKRLQQEPEARLAWDEHFCSSLPQDAKDEAIRIGVAAQTATLSPDEVQA